MLQLQIGAKTSIREQICKVKLNYPLGHYARELLRIDTNFVKPVKNDIPSDKDRHLQDSHIEFDDNGDPNLGDEGLGPHIDTGMEYV